ncbi:MAG: GerAB/ArcD/ProY family transporter [Clostridia bacterium]|nr:GerAB/ArcD/ProY family transporter [Clostridia bacterium]
MENKLLSRERLDSKQLYSLIFIIMMSVKMFMVPALIIRDAGRDGYMVMSFYIVIEMLALVVSLIAIKLAKSDICTIFERTYGKILTVTIFLLLAFYYILKISLVISEVKMFFLFSASEEFSWEIYILPLLVFLMVAAVKGLNGIGRLAQILLPIIAVSIVLLFVLIVSKPDYTNILPVLENGTGGVMNGIKKYPVWFGDLPLLCFCCGRVKREKRFILKSMVSVALSSVVVLYFSSVLFFVYAHLSKMVDYGHNISNMVVYASGNYMFGRFDLLIFCVWLTSVLVQTAYMTCVATELVRYVFRINAFWAGAGIIVALYITSNFLFRSEVQLYNFCMGVPRYFAVLSTVLLPILTLIASVVSKKGEGDKGKAEFCGQENTILTAQGGDWAKQGESL